MRYINGDWDDHMKDLFHESLHRRDTGALMVVVAIDLGTVSVYATVLGHDSHRGAGNSGGMVPHVWCHIQ